MKRFGTIFKFEFLNYIKNKAFVIVTLLLVVGIAASLSFPRLSAMFEKPEPEENVSTELSVVAVRDETQGQIGDYLSGAFPDVQIEKTYKDAAVLANDVENGVYAAAVIVKGPLQFDYIVKNIGMYDYGEISIREVIKAKYTADYMAKLGGEAADIQEVLSAVVSSNVIQTASGKNQFESFFFTYIMIFFLYMIILLYGQFVAMSVASEKSSRTMELLITSANPSHLMFGKVLGTGCAGVLQFVCILGSGIAFYRLNEEFYEGNEIISSIFNMPASGFVYAVIFLVLGFFVYAFMYGALGSLVSRTEQITTAVLPVSFVFVIAFMIVVLSISSGKVDSTLVKVCSFVPFTSPMAMFARVSMGDVAFWEVWLSIALLIAVTVGMGYLAAAIYRLGVLMYGQPPKIRQLLSLLKAKKGKTGSLISFVKFTLLKAC